VNRKNVEDIYPLSPLQQGLLFHALYSPETGAYVEQAPMLVEGDLDVDAFARAFQRTVDRHAALRTGLVWENVAQPLQVVYREAVLPVERRDWSALAEAEWRAELDAWLAADRRRGFELTRAPLLRLAFMRLGPARHVFVFTFHHAILDGWSTPLVFGEVDAFYAAVREGRTPHLPPAPRYRDYVAWLRGQDAAADEAFWRRVLDGFDTPTPLPLAAGGPAVAERHAQAGLFIPAAEHARLAAFARDNNLTLNTLVQGAWALVLARHAGERDVLFGVTVSGRPAELPGIERAVGLFINTIPFRVQVPEEGTVGAWLAGLQRLQGTMRQHEHVSLVDVQGWSAVPRDRPLFESGYVFENYPLQAEEEDEQLRFTPIHILERVSHPLSLGVVPGPELELRLSYDPARFSEDAAGRILAAVRAALRGLSESMDRPLSRVEVLADDDRRALDAWGRGPAPEGAEPVHLGVLAQAARTPDAVAVEWDGGRMTYAQLEARSRRLAHRLAAEGVRPGARVAVCMERGPEMVVALLAVLRAGAAYVPVDPDQPAERVRRLLDGVAAPVVLTQSRLAELLPADASVIAVDTLPEEEAESAAPFVDAAVDPEDIAYVIHTSGSTGTPKGVEVPHRALAAHMAWMRRRFPLGADGAVLQKTPFGFDASVWEFWAPLLEGARLVMAPPGAHREPARLMDAVRSGAVTTLQMVPSLLAVLVETPGLEACTSLRRVFAGGEALPGELVRRLRTRLDVEVVNLYGPTEACIDASFHVVGAHDSSPVAPIGRPVDGTRLYVLDAVHRLLPPGAAGELCIGGAGVARGYIGRPALTAEKFVPDAFAGVPGARMYRSGDRVRWGADGALEFLGRADLQVKVRGVRVEPGEVEAALAALPGVGAAAVVAREDRPGDVRLAAYVAPADSAAPPEPDALRRALAAVLPDAMVPSAFVVLDRLPLTPSGKTDRRALPAPGEAAGAEFVEPATATERVLAEIWSEVLGVERVGADDSFFALGGHSLLAVQAATRIRAALGVDVPLRTLFDEPRLRGLAAWLDGGADDDLDDLAAALAELSEAEMDELLGAGSAPADP
jgi:amino acid adenylation domain-containing protein